MATIQYILINIYDIQVFFKTEWSKHIESIYQKREIIKE